MKNSFINRDLVVVMLVGMFQIMCTNSIVYFIARSNLLGIVICQFCISYLWTIGVKKIAFSRRYEQLFYAFSAVIGAVLSYYGVRLV